MTPTDAIRIANSEFGNQLEEILQGNPLDEIYVHCLGAAMVAANSLGYDSAQVAKDCSVMLYGIKK
jgi:redox-regulated HSP33 family molecular chaperone